MKDNTDISTQVLCNICRAHIKKEGRETLFYCPYRKDKLISINMEKGLWNCFRQCGTCSANGGNLVHLYMLFTGERNYDRARREMKGMIGGRNEIYGRDHLKLNTEKETVDPVITDMGYRAMLGALSVNEEHMEVLKKRGMKEEDIARFDLKSVPDKADKAKCIEVIEDKLSKEGINIKDVLIPGLYVENGGKTCLNVSGSGILIPYVDIHGMITGLQIRRDDNCNCRSKSGRYRWLSSAGMKGGSSPHACYSSANYDKKASLHGKEVFITEGALKAMTARSLSGKTFFAVPGVSAFSSLERLLSDLKKAGIKKVMEAFDTDRYSNDSVMNCVYRSYEISGSMNISMRRYIGEESYLWKQKEKGVDDYFMALDKYIKSHSRVRTYDMSEMTKCRFIGP